MTATTAPATADAVTRLNHLRSTLTDAELLHVLSWADTGLPVARQRLTSYAAALAPSVQPDTLRHMALDLNVLFPDRDITITLTGHHRNRRLCLLLVQTVDETGETHLRHRTFEWAWLSQPHLNGDQLVAEAARRVLRQALLAAIGHTE